jgi:hypothetical protein
MGAQVFFDSGSGKTAEDAFQDLVDDARYEMWSWWIYRNDCRKEFV